MNLLAGSVPAVDKPVFLQNAPGHPNLEGLLDWIIPHQVRR